MFWYFEWRASVKCTSKFSLSPYTSRLRFMASNNYFRATIFLLLALASCQEKQPAISSLEQMAVKNASHANEGFRRSYEFTKAWLQERDPKTGLIPRNLNRSKDIWNAQDAAADNYPFMVLTAALLDKHLFEGDMKDMLETEIQLTSRIDHLPDTYSFSKERFENEEVNLNEVIFGASEYVKDGLLPLTEWLGPSPWRDRMINILDDIWKHAPISTAYGMIPSDNQEINGEMLQTLSRIYWMTADEKYLEWSIRLGDYYLLADHHPTRDSEQLRLRDHGCEIVSGLCELYVTVAYAHKEKQAAYRPAIHEMLDRILEIGVNEHGLMYNVVNPQTGEITNDGVADNFGYNYNGFYSVYMVDKEEKYLKAINTTLDNLGFYKSFDWENGSADGYADAIEGALNLYNRIPDSRTVDWLDSEIRIMWSMQDSSHRENTEQWRGTGIIEGWHGDGNFARTSLMYCLWKTQGTYMKPWNPDLKWGAIPEDEGILIVMEANEDWKGKLYFDQPRHQSFLNLPMDYPRINQFPEWFVVEPNKSYSIQIGDREWQSYLGTELIAGIDLKAMKGECLVLRVSSKHGKVAN